MGVTTLGLLDYLAKTTIKTASQKALIHTAGEAIGTIIEKSQNSSRPARPTLYGVPDSSANLVNKDYQEVAEMFRAYGFMNISLVPKPDLINGWLTKDGSVESVSVGGKREFKKKATFTPNVPVVITYHTFKNAAHPVYLNDSRCQESEDEADWFLPNESPEVQGYYRETEPARTSRPQHETRATKAPEPEGPVRLFCPYCGKKLFGANDRFCSECGQRLS